MKKVVIIHGISHECDGPSLLHRELVPAIQDGVKISGSDANIEPQHVDCAFYGHLFREHGNKNSDVPDYGIQDIESEFEKQFITELAGDSIKASSNEKGVTEIVQRALNELSQRRFLGGLEKFIIFFTKQAHSYFFKEGIRDAVLGKVSQSINENTKVIIAHSLGSVVAYELLMRNPDWKINTLITLGSPLGIPSVQQNLVPGPTYGKSDYPKSVTTWENIAAAGDPVALQKSLKSLFQGEVKDHYITNKGTLQHDFKGYLTAKETGSAVARALS